jgi:alkylation response protein AidB-like acyl-CoA dehydrogenase
MSMGDDASRRAQAPREDRLDFSQPLRAVFERLVESGARYDAAPLYPIESVEVLLTAGLHRLFAPPESGGETFADARAENEALTTILRLVGRADLSLGRIFEGHVNAMKLFDWYGTAEQKSWLEERLRAGTFFGVWATEPPPGVALTRDARGWVLSGAKSFATGAGGLSHAVVTARRDDGDTQLVIVPADEMGRADLSQWRVRGMRATGSGRYDLTDMRPGDVDLLGAPGDYAREPRFTAGAWRFLAVQLGGIEALLAETRHAMSDTARGDLLQRAKFADAVAATRTAYLWVREAAWHAADAKPDAADFVCMVRGIVERAALDVMELAARIIGTRSAFDGQRIDKITRDLSLYLRQAGPDQARDRAAVAWLDHDVWAGNDRLW